MSSNIYLHKRWRRICTIKSLWFLANLVCTAILIVQLAYVLEVYVNPKITHTWEEEVLLEDIDFPVVIKVCVIPGFNQTALNDVGYKDKLGYFYGINSSSEPYGDSLNYGWAGHAEGSGTFGTVEEILEKVRDKKIEVIFKEVYVLTENGNAIDIPL